MNKINFVQSYHLTLMVTKDTFCNISYYSLIKLD